MLCLSLESYALLLCSIVTLPPARRMPRGTTGLRRLQFLFCHWVVLHHSLNPGMISHRLTSGKDLRGYLVQPSAQRKKSFLTPMIRGHFNLSLQSYSDGRIYHVTRQPSVTLWITFGLCRISSFPDKPKKADSKLPYLCTSMRLISQGQSVSFLIFNGSDVIDFWYFDHGHLGKPYLEKETDFCDLTLSTKI